MHSPVVSGESGETGETGESDGMAHTNDPPSAPDAKDAPDTPYAMDATDATDATDRPTTASTAAVVLAAIRDRRSIRHFTEDPVSRAAMETILDAGRWAPSGLNNQPYRMLPIPAGDPRQEALAQLTRYARIVREARALIAVCLDLEAMYHPMKDHQGVGACIQNMLLAIHALGLGGVWLGEIVNQADAALDVLQLDGQRYEFQALVALGRPLQAKAPNRKSLEEHLLAPLEGFA